MDDLQERLESSRERLLLLLEALPDEALLEPDAVGHWSIADLLAHLAAWESELVTALMRLQQGRKPEAFLQAIADRDAYNTKRYTENKERDLDRIFADFQGVRVHLEQWVDEFNRRDLNQKGRYTWFPRDTLAEVIARYSIEHEESHLPAVEAYARRWRADTAAGNNPPREMKAGRE
jgi:uncharacterized damage-inducible protein DinB